MSNNFNIDDIEAWARDERRDNAAQSSLLRSLVGQIELDRKLPQPNALRPGSPERLIADARHRRIGTTATLLGYQPPIREAVAEVVKHHVIDASPLSRLQQTAIEAAGDGEGAPGKRRPKPRRPDTGLDGGRDLTLGGFDS